MSQNPLAVASADCNDCKTTANKLQSENRASASDCNAVAPTAAISVQYRGLQYCSNPDLDGLEVIWSGTGLVRTSALASELAQTAALPPEIVDAISDALADALVADYLAEFGATVGSPRGFDRG